MPCAMAIALSQQPVLNDMPVSRERIDRLATLAGEAIDNDEPSRAREYVRLAKRIAERNRSGLPRTFVRKTCDACAIYLKPGRTSRVRLQSGHIAVRCLECGETARYPYD